MRQFALSIIMLAVSFILPCHLRPRRRRHRGTGCQRRRRRQLRKGRTAPWRPSPERSSKTAAGGEISVLDPGGFGAVTITKSISITNDGVGESGVLVSGTNGIVISAGPNDIVNLRGIFIVGFGGALSGVRFTSGAQLNIQNCVIRGFNDGNLFGIEFYGGQCLLRLSYSSRTR